MDYENLGFQVGVDSKEAETRLDRIIEKLEYIHKLEGKKLPKKGGSSNTNVGDPKEEKQVKKNTKALGSYLAKLTSVVVIARKFAQFMGSAIRESANYIENLNLFAVAYGKSYEQQLDWALGIAEAYGLANNEVLKFAGTFRELSTSLGIVGDTADLVSQTITNLAYDLSALFNTTVAQAAEKLQSGVFSGNVRPLRSYGIDISQQQINALFETNEALRQLGVNAQNLNQSDKVLARLIITLQSGKDSFGTMAREINNLQSQFRIFQGSLSNFKLAIGDLLEEPLSRVMVLLNAVIIALTNVIRTFVPLQTRDETPKAIINTALGAEQANEELDELNGKLASFDKFNVLQQGNQSSSSLAVTEALNQALLEQTNIYDKELTAALEKMNNEAVELAKNIQDIVVVGGTLLTVFAISKFVSIKNSLKMISEGFALLTGSTTKLNTGLSLTNTLLITGLVYTIYKMVEAFREGDYFAGSLAAVIGVVLVGALLKLNSSMLATIKINISGWIKRLIVDFKALEFGSSGLLYTFGLLGLGIFAFIRSFDDMSPIERSVAIFASLAAAITGVAIALAATHNWAKALMIGGMVAGGMLTVSSLGSTIKGFANGGYTNANLIMTHENGKREWVGKAAGSSAIVNDTQMSDIMEMAVAKGVFSAMRANSAMGSTTTTEQPIIVKIGEEEVFRVVRRTANRHGQDFAKV